MKDWLEIVVILFINFPIIKAANLYFIGQLDADVANMFIDMPSLVKF